MADYDLVVRGGTVVTAADSFRADIGIRGGRIAAVGEDLEGASRIDADGLLVMPGGVDSHCHIEQLRPEGGTDEESFVTGSASALAGGTTTAISFAMQFKGVGLLETLAEYRRRAASAMIDHSFHQIITDPNEAAVHEEIPRLVAEGVRSLKVFLTYDSLQLDDRGFLAVLASARRAGALVTVHCENYDAIAWRTDGAAGGRADRAQIPRLVAPCGGGAGGDLPRHRAGRARGPADPGVPRLLRRGGRGDRPGAGPRPEGLGGDLPAISGADRDRHGPPGLRGGEIHVQPAAARPAARPRGCGSIFAAARSISFPPTTAGSVSRGRSASG